MANHLNMGLNEIIKIYQHHKNIYSNSGESLDETLKKVDQINILTTNCCCICNCLEKIVTIRNLDNFNPISPQLKSVLLQILNQVYMDLVHLEDPLLAYQITKIIQLLSLEKTE